MNLPRPPFTRFVWLLLTLLALSACQQTPAPTLPSLDTLAATPGTVVAWGRNVEGQTTVPTDLSNVTTIAGGSHHSLALKGDDTVVAWGRNSEGQSTVPTGLSGVVAVAGGDFHSLALMEDGTVVAWGDNNFGQTAVPADLSDVVAVAGGGIHSLALKEDGTVVAWGNNDSGQTNVPTDLSGVTAIAGGGIHSLALKGDGTVVAWGDNFYGQTTVPTGLSGVVAVAGGFYHSLALKSDGTIVAWGDNFYGQTTVPTGLSGVVAIAGGYLHSLALKGDGTVVAWGRNHEGQTTVPADLSNVVAIAGGSLHSLALVAPPSDTTAPTITLSTPIEGAVYLLNQLVSADYTCEDEAGGTGLASCVGAVANGAAIDTASVGSKSFTVNATDNAGNSAAASASYTVTYGFEGFLRPVDNDGTLNVAKAGQKIPLKWRLTDAAGNPVTTLASVTVTAQNLSCSLGSDSGEVEEYAAGASGLQNLGDGYYQFNWATPRSYAGTCKTMHLNLGEGTTRSALFKFSR